MLSILENIDRVLMAPNCSLRWVSNKNIGKYQQVQTKHWGKHASRSRFRIYLIDTSVLTNVNKRREAGWMIDSLYIQWMGDPSRRRTELSSEAFQMKMIL